MLVLSRQRDEVIVIGDDIQVTLVDIRGDKVRLGISAPKEVSVHRKEVYDAIKRENRAAAAPVNLDLERDQLDYAENLKRCGLGGVPMPREA
jgi:carbon storage regulator